MWPWEHLAVGYLVYSLGRRALGRGPPAGGAVVALAFGTLLPDLVDKPLSWGLGWTPSGYAAGHSALVAVPVGLGLLHLGRRRGRTRWPGAAVAFVVGHWVHLLADVANPLRYGGGLLPQRVLWPVAAAPPYGTDHGLGRGLVYLAELFATLSTMPPAALVLGYLLLPAVSVGLWILDGSPGLALTTRTLRGVARRLRRITSAR